MKTKTNILDHELIPKHILLSEEEKKNVMKMYGVKKINQFPKILKSDPVIRLLGGKSGDLVKIIRKSDITGESIYYRVVMEG